MATSVRRNVSQSSYALFEHKAYFGKRLKIVGITDETIGSCDNAIGHLFPKDFSW